MIRRALALRRQIHPRSLVDYVALQPDECRTGLIALLIEKISSLNDKRAGNRSVHEVLLLASERPPNQQVRLRKGLIMEINSTYDSSTQFAKLAAFERVVRRLPPQSQVELLGKAADTASWFGTPFMEARLAALLAAARALPQAEADRTLELIANALLTAVDHLGDAQPDALPDCFDAIVDTCKVVPQSMQVRVLAALIETMKDYPPGSAQSARDLVLPLLQALPDDLSAPLFQLLNA